MIHYRENCNCKTVHLTTDICTECSHHNHYAFILHTKNGTNSSDETEQKVLHRLRTDPSVKFRIGSKRHSSCGHPGIWQGSTCAICAQKRRDERAQTVKKSVSAAEYESEALRQNIDTVKGLIADLNAQLETMTNALTLSQMGLTTGVIKIKSPRQQAIAEGKKWYMPYEPCKHCHIVAERYVANGKCRNCGS